MQVVAVDILVHYLPEATSIRNKYAFVASDYFTPWTEYYEIRNQEVIKTASKLVDKTLLHFSPPDWLHSDQGSVHSLDHL